jgi:membrane-bound ClpP family serine protease
MNWYLTILFIVLGIALFVVEIFILPGFGIVGLMALCMQVFGVYSAYSFNADAGLYSLLFTILADIVIVIIGLKQVKSGKWSVNQTIDSRVSQPLFYDSLSVGQLGTTITALRPNGKVEFGDNRTEVFSLGEFIEATTSVKIVKIEDGKIFVNSIK